VQVRPGLCARSGARTRTAHTAHLLARARQPAPGRGRIGVSSALRAGHDAPHRDWPGVLMTIEKSIFEFTCCSVCVLHYTDSYIATYSATHRLVDVNRTNSIS
jgi:hypothetical protein